MPVFYPDILEATDANVRLTLDQGVPVADNVTNTTIFLEPYNGDKITLFNGTQLRRYTVARFTYSLAVPATTNQMYDVFLADVAGTLTLSTTAWTNDTTRATTLTMNNGFLTLNGDATKRYLGSLRTNSVSGQTESSSARRFVWNYYNRVRQSLFRDYATASWTQNTVTTWRQANSDSANRVEIVIGVSEVTIDLSVFNTLNGSAGATTGWIAIGEDTTTTLVTEFIGGQGPVANAQYLPIMGRMTKMPVAGYHAYNWIEMAQGNVALTWFNQNYGGLMGWTEG